MTATLQNENNLTLTGENLKAFKKAMKIAYYKTFRKNGLITDKQFEILMKMQNEQNSDEE